MGSRQLQVSIAAGYILLLVVACIYTGFYEGRGMYSWMAVAFLITAVGTVHWGRKLRDKHRSEGQRSLYDLEEKRILSDTGKCTDSCDQKRGLDSACTPSRRASYANLLVVAVPFIMAVLYGAHLLTSPVSMQGTLDQALRWAFYGVFAAGLASAAKLPKARAVLRTGPAACAAILTAAGLAAVYGLLPLPHAVLRTASAELSAAGARLGGLLEYPNTLGAVFGALLLERLASLSRANPRAAKLRQALGAALALGCAASLLLTESRGAWLCTAAGWTAALALAGRAARQQLLLQTAILGGGGLWVYRQLAGAGLAPAQLPGLAELAGAATCTLALSLVARGYCPSAPQRPRRPGRPAPQRLHHLGLLAPQRQHRPGPSAFQRPRHLGPLAPQRPRRPGPPAFQRPRHLGPLAPQRQRRPGLLAPLRPRRPGPFAPQRLRRLVVTAACCAWVGLALALSVPGSGGAGLVRTGTSTVSARLLMYRDAIEQIRNTPLWGRGGDVWRSVYRSIQSQPYVGAQVHSGYIDILLNLGVIGLIVILTWITAAGLLLYRRRSPWLAPFIVLTLHAGIDFDMSYGLIWLLLIWIPVLGTNGIPVRRMRALSMESRIFLLPGQIPTPAHTYWIHLVTRLYNRNSPSHTLPDIPRPPEQERVKGKRSLNYAPRLIAGPAAMLFLLLSMVSLSLMQSERLTGQALQLITMKNNPEAVYLLKRAIQLAPYRSIPRLVLSSVTDSADAEKLLREGIKYNPVQPELWWGMGRIQSKQGNPAAILALEKAVLLDRYNSGRHTAVLREFNALVLRLNRAGRISGASCAAQTGLALYRRDQLLAHTLGLVKNVRNDRKFRITEAERQQALLLESSSSSKAPLPFSQPAIRQMHP
ncbi:O-antigen ligase domain-containing protein [Paenibacillus zeisoli]|uniref:O-antigen ligase domain-containing protein n=1 Tax=Paenibacillus zeisoli TaxID=2496267 RepID=A0A3S1BQY4_9BACL|nr:O-antigen ligase family protein [Paenibacillus zeisoli]RUT28923.1 O-antigen ligase domain-containing protein [Paenibacillus zeisoli]